MSKKSPEHELENISNKFYQQYGATLAAWSHVEMMLYSFFQAITKLSPLFARRIFYSARSFLGRSDMIAALIPVATLTENQKEFLKGVLKKAAAYYSFRNTIVHGEPIVDLRDESKFFNQMVLTQGKLEELNDDTEAVTIEQLEIAEHNYTLFAGIILRALGWDGKSDESSPQKCLELVHELPNLPHSKKADPMPLAPPPPLQASQK